jgi:hypothetical protein
MEKEALGACCMSDSGYFSSPWPAEDGGPQRLQIAHPSKGAVTGLSLQSGEKLRCTSRNTLMSTMTVLGAKGEVFLLTHSAIRAKLGLPTTACVERIDPVTLRRVHRSPRLRGGPMWPGGMAVHANGDLYVGYGRYLHRLNRHCEVRAELRLPVDQPYNSFVVLNNGLIVTKNLSESTCARLSVVHADTVQFAAADVDCPEPSIARLSAIGNSVYVVGVRSIFRYHWSETTARLELDPDWRFDYIGNTQQTFGWDVVLDGNHAWFMDNGKHRYLHKMINAGVSRTPNRLIRVSMHDAKDHQILEVCGAAGGSVTNPPLFDLKRNIVVGFDSANRHLRAWRFDMRAGTLTPLWHKQEIGCASHMVLYPEAGELFTNDYRRFGEEVVMLDIETGTERGRVRIGGINQGVVFPSVGWDRDLYWSSMTKVARIYVQ